MGAVSRFGLDAYGPNESQKFSSDRSGNVRLILARGSEFLVPGMQSMLRFPGDLLDVIGQPLFVFSVVGHQSMAGTDRTTTILR
jgi:hypothetical protein